VSGKWPLVPLGEVLQPASRTEVVDALKEYRLLGVRLDAQGPFLRETVTGAQTSATRLFRVVTGDFIYSRLFACRGAFGVIGPDLNGCYVSGEFPTFTPVSDRIDVRYLAYWFRLPATLVRVNEDCSGSTPLTRNRFNERFFLRLEIPLPPLEEQRRIVDHIEQVDAGLQGIAGLSTAVQNELDACLRAAYHLIVQEATSAQLGEVAPLCRRPVAIEEGAQYHQVAVRSFGKGTFHKPPLAASDVTWQKLFLVRDGDILLSNIKAWEGAIAVATAQDDRRVGSHRYLTCVADSALATARFICYHLLTPCGLHDIGEASPGSADRNRTLSVKALLRIRIPLPSLQEQRWFGALYDDVQAAKAIRGEVDADLTSLHGRLIQQALTESI